MASNPARKPPCGGCKEDLRSVVDILEVAHADLAKLRAEHEHLLKQYLLLAQEYDKVLLHNGIPKDAHVSGTQVSPASSEGAQDLEHEHPGKLVQSVQGGPATVQRWEIGNKRHLPARESGNPGGPVQRRG